MNEPNATKPATASSDRTDPTTKNGCFRAAVVVAVFGVGLYMQHVDNATQVKTAAVQQSSSSATTETNIDAMADYIMCDDYELYAYLADE